MFSNCAVRTSSICFIFLFFSNLHFSRSDHRNWNSLEISTGPRRNVHLEQFCKSLWKFGGVFERFLFPVLYFLLCLWLWIWCGCYLFLLRVLHTSNQEFNYIWGHKNSHQLNALFTRASVTCKISRWKSRGF